MNTTFNPHRTTPLTGGVVVNNLAISTSFSSVFAISTFFLGKFAANEVVQDSPLKGSAFLLLSGMSLLCLAGSVQAAFDYLTQSDFVPVVAPIPKPEISSSRTTLANRGG
jgi:hypothetical protein